MSKDDFVFRIVDVTGDDDIIDSNDLFDEGQFDIEGLNSIISKVEESIDGYSDFNFDGDFGEFTISFYTFDDDIEVVTLKLQVTVYQEVIEKIVSNL